MGRAYQNRKVSMAKTADAKTKVYSKYGREIYVCAKSGGIDPSGNLTLRGLIDRAKKDQVPGHVIEKALDKAKGGGGEDFAPARYEGFGPGGCMVIVDCLTDNPNRTFGDVRQCFTKTKCKIGTPGSVSHMFDHSAILAAAPRRLAAWRICPVWPEAAGAAPARRGCGHRSQSRRVWGGAPPPARPPSEGAGGADGAAGRVPAGGSRGCRG